jgi:hypothetical protein
MPAQDNLSWESVKGVCRRDFLSTAAGLAALPSLTRALELASDKKVATVHVDTAPDQALNSFIPDQALGSSMDILPYGVVDQIYTEPIIKQALSAGWGLITYRLNTELRIAAWHWNDDGTWSDPTNQAGYFTGNSEPRKFLRHSYSYPLPRRGHTRNGGADRGYSRLTDGNPESYWKSNPYLSPADSQARTTRCILNGS